MKKKTFKNKSYIRPKKLFKPLALVGLFLVPISNAYAYQTYIYEQNSYVEPIEELHIENDNQIRIIRTYRINNGTNELLPTENFNLQGLEFVFDGFEQQEQEDLTRRNHTQLISIETRTSDIRVILENLGTQRWHRDDYGFRGYLEIDHSTISTTPMPYRYDRRVMNYTRNYTNKSFGDISGMRRTMTRNGVQMTLHDVTWSANTTNVDFHDVANTYNATAHFRGYYSVRNIPGFITTANFTGVIENPNIILDMIYDVHFVSQIQPEAIEEINENIIEEIKGQNQTENLYNDDIYLNHFPKEETSLNNLSPFIFLAFCSPVFVVLGVAAYKKGWFNNFRNKETPVDDTLEETEDEFE